ncbi:hypothetical protein [Scardovia wiggsiae]
MLSDKKYARRVRVAVFLFITITIIAPFAAVRIMEYMGNWPYNEVSLSYSMLSEFHGDHGVPFGWDNPEGFSATSRPSAWPADPIAANKVQDIKRAIIFYNSRYPDQAVSFNNVKTAYGKDLKRNVCEGWRQDKKVHKFIKWCRREASLVYVRNTTDPDMTVHHKGERTRRRYFTNFDYVIDRDKRGDSNTYKLADVQEDGND